MATLDIPFFDTDSFDPVAELSRDIIVADSDDDLDAESRERKRQRIENAAKRYLAGQSLPIHSASLRGPFDPANWKNPWKKPRQDKQNPFTVKPRPRRRRQREPDYGANARPNSKRKKTRKLLNTANGDKEFSRRIPTEKPSPKSTYYPEHTH